MVYRSINVSSFVDIMYKIVLVCVVAFTMVQDIQSCCCVSREPYMTRTCIECLFDLCPGYCPPKCGCFKDIANPMGSSTCQCGCKSLYFPEVEYPCTCFNLKPFYFGSCFEC